MQAGNEWSNILPKSSQVRKKPPPPPPPPPPLPHYHIQGVQENPNGKVCIKAQRPVKH